MEQTEIPQVEPGPWMQTFTGKQVFPFSLQPEDINIHDIAHALAMVCRYNGHCKQFYSVAEHSLRVSQCLPAEFRLWGLLHDAGEAYLGDVTSPFKDRTQVSGMPFRYWEDKILRTIAEMYNLPWPPPPEIKAADKILLATEARDIMLPPPKFAWDLPHGPLYSKISVTWTPGEAEHLYLRAYDQLQWKTDESTQR